MEIRLKRAYDAAEDGDGYRVYVDRLWPQGLSHKTFHYDLWAKDIAPSAQLREWFHADPEGRWEKFKTRYMNELESMPAFAELKETLAKHHVVTLLFSSKNREHNNAVVLDDALEDNMTN